MQASVLRRRRGAAARAAAAEGAGMMMTLGRRRTRCCRRRRWSATAPCGRARAQRHAQPAARRPVRRAEGRALRCARLPRRRRRRAARSRRSPSAASAEAGLPGLQVADTQHALTASSPRAWRRRFQLPLIAVDRQQRQDHGHADDRVDPAAPGSATRAFATRGNLNNHIGVPLTLLRLRQDDDDLAPRRRRRARHEPPGRDRRAGGDRRADRRAGQQRAARAPGVHGQRRGGRARERRA